MVDEGRVSLAGFVLDQETVCDRTRMGVHRRAGCVIYQESERFVRVNRYLTTSSKIPYVLIMGIPAPEA